MERGAVLGQRQIRCGIFFKFLGGDFGSCLIYFDSFGLATNRVGSGMLLARGAVVSNFFDGNFVEE